MGPHPIQLVSDKRRKSGQRDSGVHAHARAHTHTHTACSPGRPLALVVPSASLHFPQTSTWFTPSSPSGLYSKVTLTVRPSLMALFKTGTSPQQSIPLPCFIFLGSAFHHPTYDTFYLILWLLFLPTGRSFRRANFSCLFSLSLYPQH